MVMCHRISRAAMFLAVYLLFPGHWSYGDTKADAEKSFLDLKKRAEAITRQSSRDEVSAILGEPLHTKIAGWSRPDVDEWRYLSYTDDEEDLSFAVYFDPKNGTSVSASRNFRTEEGARKVARGTILQAHRSEGDIVCEVRWDDGQQSTLSVAKSQRVRGEPEVGGRVQLEHRGDLPGHYIFHGPYSLYLDAMQFSKP